jgi:hypothetical protein
MASHNSTSEVELKKLEEGTVSINENLDESGTAGLITHGETDADLKRIQEENGHGSSSTMDKLKKTMLVVLFVCMLGIVFSSWVVSHLGLFRCRFDCAVCLWSWKRAF